MFHLLLSILSQDKIGRNGGSCGLVPPATWERGVLKSLWIFLVAFRDPSFSIEGGNPGGRGNLCNRVSERCLSNQK